MAAATAAASPATRPDYLPESFWDKDKSTVKADDFKAHLENLEKLKSDTDARRALVPQTLDLYKPELPADVKLPDGWQIATDDPSFVKLRAAAHAKSWTQEDLSEVLGVYAGIEAAKHEQITVAMANRDRAMGDNGPARVESLTKWFDAIMPDPNHAMQMKQTLWTPVICKFFEGVQKLMTSQGVTSFNGSGRDGELARKDGLPNNYEAMKPVDKLTLHYAQQRAGSR